MSIRSMLDDLRAKVMAVSDLSINKFFTEQWTVADWFHRLSKINPADARKFAGEFVTGLPDDDAELMAWLAGVPPDYEPPMPPGSTPANAFGCPDEIVPTRHQVWMKLE